MEVKKLNAKLCFFRFFFFYSLKMIKLLICVQSIYCSSLCHRDQWDGWMSVCVCCACVQQQNSPPHPSIHPSIAETQTKQQHHSCRANRRRRGAEEKKKFFVVIVGCISLWRQSILICHLHNVILWRKLWNHFCSRVNNIAIPVSAIYENEYMCSLW